MFTTRIRKLSETTSSGWPSLMLTMKRAWQGGYWSSWTMSWSWKSFVVLLTSFDSWHLSRTFLHCWYLSLFHCWYALPYAAAVCTLSLRVCMYIPFYVTTVCTLSSTLYVLCTLFFTATVKFDTIHVYSLNETYILCSRMFITCCRKACPGEATRLSSISGPSSSSSCLLCGYGYMVGMGQGMTTDTPGYTHADA